MSNLIELRSKDSRSTKLNVLGKPIEECSCDPMTGWTRDGTCSTDENDQGLHVVCCLMTEEFLAFSKSQGNDLSTPQVHFGFPGLKSGDHWCLCAARWREAWEAGCAPAVFLSATHQSALGTVPLEILTQYAADIDQTH